ncbi:MAG: glycosyltransferase family 1 protein [Planctomycetaceae bacterium]
MRIAIIAEVYLPKIDGVVIRTLNLIRELQAAGDEVLVICPETDGARHSPADVVEFPSFCFPMYPEYRIGRPDSRLEAALRDFRPDVVHFLNPFAFGFQCYDRMAAAGMQVGTLYSFHTLYAEFVKRYGILRPLSKLLWWQTRHYHNKADANLTVSQSQVDDLLSRNFERVHLWQPAIDSTLFRPLQRNSANLSRRQDSTYRLLTVSRLAPEKNVEFLRDVLEQLLPKIPDASLTIVGDGPHRPALERHFAGLPVTFEGYLQGEELAAAYATSDAFVYASETETMGNVILEAMACGIPVIAPRAGGIPSLLRHQQSGLLFEPGDAAAAADFVLQSLSNECLRNALIRAAREFAEQHDWTTAAQRVRQDYLRAVNRFSEQPSPMSPSNLFARATTQSLVTAFRVVSWLTQKTRHTGTREATFVFDSEESEHPVHQTASPRRNRQISDSKSPESDDEFSELNELLDETIPTPVTMT